MLIGTSFNAFGVGVAAMVMVAGRSVQAVPWTEKFIFYNNGDASSCGESGPYFLDDPCRQHLHILQTPSSNNKPTPVFFHAHGNGGTASDVGPDDLDIFMNAGYSVISWESVTTLSTAEGTEACWSDFDLVWEWFQDNAVQRNLDPDSVVIGGRSRGSVCSWQMAHSQKPAIHGLYMYNALPNNAWVAESPWVEDVTAESPPAYLVYGPECEKPITQDCVPSPDPQDDHNPRNGQKIVDRYTELGIASMITLTDGLHNADMRLFDFFPEFAASLANDGPWTEMYIPYNNGDASLMGDDGPYDLDDPLRQYLHLLQNPLLSQPSPVFFHAHGNGGDADLTADKLEIFVKAGYSVISWESVGEIENGDEIDVCWSDFDLVWDWFEANAVQRNLNPNSVVIGGRSRGSICSWPMAHSQKPAIRGLYMNGALPDPVWFEGSPWLEEVTSGSPPAYLLYKPFCEKPIMQNCKPLPNENDIHNPRNGQKVVDRYTELGMASMIKLTDGLENDGIGIFDLFPAFAASLENDDEMVYVPLPSSTTPGGHCMDGSMAGYYIREGTDPNLFVIYLKGGGSCTTQSQCKNRVNTDLGSSTNYAPAMKGDTFLNANCNENPLFCKASAVFIPYCSSDGHMGTAEKSAETWEYYFEGHLNFKAITEHLILENGLDDTNNEMKVLVAGNSAGGRGAFANVDGLQERLPLAMVKTASTCGWSEPSALAGDLPPLYPPSNYSNFAAGTHGTALYDFIQNGGEVVDVHKIQEGSALPVGCLERYVNETHNLWWACTSMERAYQYIKAPIFNIHTLYDTNHIYEKGGVPQDIVNPVEADTAKEYIDMYGKAVLTSFQKILNNETGTVKEHPDGVFAASCLTHGTANDVTIAGGYTKIDLVGDWFFQLGELTEYHRQIEQCPDTDGLQLPCNPAKNCRLQIPSRLVEACTREITDAGCLNQANANKCYKCAKENQDAISKGGCKSKDRENLKRVAKEICEFQDAPPSSKVHIDKVIVGSTARGNGWKPKLEFKIRDSETNEKVKGVKFTIGMSYGNKSKTKSCTSKKTGKCAFKLGKVPKSKASVQIAFLGASSDGVVYDGSNNVNREGCKVFSEDCLTFDILSPV